jgi:hypothetical protein
VKAEEAANEADLLAATHPVFRSDRLLLLGLEHRGEDAADTALKLAQRDSDEVRHRPQIALVDHPAGVVEVVGWRVAEGRRPRWSTIWRRSLIRHGRGASLLSPGMFTSRIVATRKVLRPRRRALERTI